MTALRLITAVAVALAVPAVVMTATAGAEPTDWQAAASLARRAVPESPPFAPVRSAPTAHNDPAPVPKATAMPEATTTEVTLGRRGEFRRLGRSPIEVAAHSPAGSGRTVRVDLLDATAAARAGVSGFAFRLSGHGAAALPLSLSVEYSAFAERFGAGYADRLRLVTLPACAVADPRPVDCPAGGVPLPSRTDHGRGRLIADIDALRPKDDAVLMAVTAAADGEEGAYTATPLNLSGDWQVNAGSGDFSYSHEIPLSPAPSGPTPDLTLHYSSAGVDGLVSGRNTQGGPVGVGWGDLADSFIERRYTSCRSDGGATADLCWKSDNATISLNGQSGDLVPVPGSSPRQWRLRDDARWRIEQLTGAGNGDNDGEYWRVTTPDGVQYFFGRGVNPDVGTETDSVWTVPVIGDDPGEPCATATPVAWCPQAWRWNLDLVIDPHDNVQQYEYTKELNHYAALNGQPGFQRTEYVRSGTLLRIKYGKRRTGSEVIPAAVVEIDTAYRCASLENGCPAPTPDTAASYPDTPVDLMCFDSICTEHSPTFFTAARYTTITAQVNDGDRDGPWAEVDRFQFLHGFPDPDVNRLGDRKLFLTGVQRTGLTAADRIVLPPVTFSPVALNNRVDVAGGLSAMPHYRIGTVTNEFGGQLAITYGQPHPCPSPVPDQPNWHLNTRDCFPNWYTPDSGASGFAVFNKYVVTSVRQRDPLGGSPDLTTSYRYGDQVAAGLPNGAWHHDRDEAASNDVQSWSEWRGYADVVVSQGDARSQYRYFRGMNSDRLAGDPFPGPGSRAVRVSSLDGTVTNAVDENWLAGLVLDQQSLRTNGTVEAGVVNGYHVHRTVDITSPDPLEDAWFVAPADQVERRRDPATGTHVRKRTQTVYNGLLGTIDRVIEHGWTHVSGDERCTVTTPSFNTTTWLLDLPAAITRYGNASCVGAEITHEEFAYDDGTFGAAPTRGDKTGTRKKITSAPTWATTTIGYDPLGRVLSVTDPNGHTTTTAFEPELRYPATSTVTNHLDHVTTTEFLRPRQAPRTVTDARGKRTTFGYDALGRSLSVHRPTEQAAGAPASVEFRYDLDPNRGRPGVVRTRRLQDGTGGSARYVDEWAVYDSWVRPRQVQTLSPEAGKVIVTDTGYDNRGLTARKSLPQAVGGNAGELLPTPTAGWANDTTTAYDELNRPVWVITRAAGAYRRSTVTTYTHDTTTTTPDPPGGGVVRTVNDAYDRPVRVEELEGSAWRPTVYGYDPADRLTTITDPAGNTITNTYDLAGRKVALVDADLGAWTYGYDAAGNQNRANGPGGIALFTGYDALDRKDRTPARLGERDDAGQVGVRRGRRDRAPGPVRPVRHHRGVGQRRHRIRRSVPADRPHDHRAPGRHRAEWRLHRRLRLRRRRPPDQDGLSGRRRSERRDRHHHVQRAGSARDHGRWRRVRLGRRLRRPGQAAVGAVRIAVRPLQPPARVRRRPARGAPADGHRGHPAPGHPVRLRADLRHGRRPEHDAEGPDLAGVFRSRRPATPGPRLHHDGNVCHGHSRYRRQPVRPHLRLQRGRQPHAAGGGRHNDHLHLPRSRRRAPARPHHRRHGRLHLERHRRPGRPHGLRPDRHVHLGHRAPADPGRLADRRHVVRVRRGRRPSDAANPDRDHGLRRGSRDHQAHHGRGHRGAHLHVRKDPHGDPLPRRSRVPRHRQPGLGAAHRPDLGDDTLEGPDLPALRTSAHHRHHAHRPWLHRPGRGSWHQPGYLNARYYDAVIGRFISPDPLFAPENPQTINPYAYGLNNPTAFTDPSGLLPDECRRNSQLQCVRAGKVGNTVPKKAPPPPPEICAPGTSGSAHPTCAPERRHPELELTGAVNEFLDEVELGATTADTVVDTAGLGVELCTARRTECAEITNFSRTLEGHGGEFIGWFAVGATCLQERNGNCAWAIASEAFELVPVAGQIWVGVKTIDAFLGTNMEGTAKEAVFTVVREFFDTVNRAPVTTYDPEVRDAYGGRPVLPHGGPSASQDCSGGALAPPGHLPAMCAD